MPAVRSPNISDNAGTKHIKHSRHPGIFEPINQCLGPFLPGISQLGSSEWHDTQNYLCLGAPGHPLQINVEWKCKKNTRHLRIAGHGFAKIQSVSNIDKNLLLDDMAGNQLKNKSANIQVA